MSALLLEYGLGVARQISIRTTKRFQPLLRREKWMKIKKMSKMRRHQQKGRPSKMLTPVEISVIQELVEQGKSQVKISELTGFSRKTIRFYLSGAVREGGFLERNKEQILQWFKDCEGHCPPLKRKIEENLGKSVNLQDLIR